MHRRTLPLFLMLKSCQNTGLHTFKKFHKRTRTLANADRLQRAAELLLKFSCPVHTALYLRCQHVVYYCRNAARILFVCQTHTHKRCKITTNVSFLLLFFTHALLFSCVPPSSPLQHGCTHPCMWRRTLRHARSV